MLDNILPAYGDMPAIPLDDRGLAYGDGLFETILVRDGVPTLWAHHCDRLLEGAQRLNITPPGRAWLDSLPAHAGAGEKVLKIVLTRGSGGRGYRVPVPARPRCHWFVNAFASQERHWQEGVTVRLCQLRLAHQPALAGIKHLNRLENVLARQEWLDEAIAEGILLNMAGHPVEATAMNLAFRDHGCWWTPALSGCGVEGTLRRALVASGVLTPLDDVPLERLAEADGFCLFNSVQGLWPVTGCYYPDNQHVLGRWAIDSAVRELQAMAHDLLGYPAVHSTS